MSNAFETKSSGLPRFIPQKAFWYVIREVSPYFALSLLFTTSVVSINEIAQFSELFVKRNVPLTVTGALLIGVVINALVITIPISLLIGIMIGFARLSSNNEIVGLMTSGISRSALLIPLFSFSLGSLFLMSFLTFQGAPYAARTILAIQTQLMLHKARTQVKSKVFDTRFENCMLYIEEVNRRNDQWSGVLISMSSAADKVLITGQHGVLETQDESGRSVLHIFNGAIHRLERAAAQRYTYHTEHFSSYHVRIDLLQKPTKLHQADLSGSVKAASMRDLLSFNDKENKKLYLKARVEFHKRLLLPLSCLVFTPFALLLGLPNSTVSPAKGAFMAIFIALIYYSLLFVGEKLTLSGSLPPFLGMWVGTIILAACGGVAFNWKQFSIVQDRGFRIVQALLSFNKIIKLIYYQFINKRNIKENRKRSLLPVSGWHIDRYITLHVFLFHYLTTTFLISIYLIFTLVELSPDLVGNDIGLSYLIRYLLFLVPQVFTQTAAPCLLVGSLITISIIVRTNQMLALVSNGISIYRITAPFFFYAIIMLVLIFFVQAYVIPKTGPHQDDLRFYIKKGRFPTLVERSLLSQSGNWMYGGQNQIYHFSSFNQHYQSLHNLLVLEIEDRRNMVIKKRIHAEVATWDTNTRQWLLTNVVVWNFSNNQVVQETYHEHANIDLPMSPDFLLRKLPKPEFLTFDQLKLLTQNTQQGGYDTTEMRIALYRYVAFPFSCVIMTLIGLSFGFAVGPKGVFVSAGSGVLLGAAFWFGLELFEKLGKYDYIHPNLSAWGVNIILGSIGIYKLFRVRT